MKYTKVFTIILVSLLLISYVGMPVLADETDASSLTQTSQVNGCHGLDASTAYLGTGMITDNLGSAVLYEVNSDTLMYATNEDVRMYPSSLVKIVTAMVAIEKGNLQDVVTVRQQVLDTVPYYAASADLVDGEEITLSDLLYCLMVGSANDAAAVIATHISGSQQAFVEEMNRYAVSLGCNGTQFVNVHGLHDDDQYTTARDMARIVVDAVKDDKFLTYFTTARYVVPGTNKTPDGRSLSTGNYLMNDDTIKIYYDPRVLGGRTGVTEEGPRCLASLSEVDGMRLVCIVMGSKSTYDEQGNTAIYGSFKETSALLDAGFNGYQVVQVLYENQALRQCSVANGANDVILASAASSYSVLPAGVGVGELSFRYADDGAQFSAPIESGQVLSTIQVWYGGLCIGEADLIAMNSVQQVTAEVVDQNQSDNDLNTPKKRTSNIAFVVIAVIIGIAVLVFLATKVSKKMQAISIQKRSNQYRKYRRRSR